MSPSMTGEAISYRKQNKLNSKEEAKNKLKKRQLLKKWGPIRPVMKQAYIRNGTAMIIKKVDHFNKVSAYRVI